MGLPHSAHGSCCAASHALSSLRLWPFARLGFGLLLTARHRSSGPCTPACRRTCPPEQSRRRGPDAGPPRRARAASRGSSPCRTGALSGQAGRDSRGTPNRKGPPHSMGRPSSFFLQPGLYHRLPCRIVQTSGDRRVFRFPRPMRRRLIRLALVDARYGHHARSAVDVGF